MTLSELIRDDVLDPPSAAFLTTVVRSGLSLTIAAGRSGAGKTTILSALIEAVAPHRRRVFVRGAHHIVRLANDDIPATTLLINEISPHLPCYVWGDALRAALSSGRGGAQILATTHAESPEELIYRLATPPMRLSSAEIASLGVIAFLDGPCSRTYNLGALGSIVHLSPSPAGGLEIDLIKSQASGTLDEGACDRLLERFRLTDVTYSRSPLESR